MPLSDEDVISRCIIFSKAFQDGMHLDKLLIIFPQAAADGRCHESGVSRKLAPTDAEVHSIGCGIAEKQNADRGNPPPGLKRRYYVGFRSARVSDLPLAGENYIVELTEDGEGPAHVDIALTILTEDKSQRATIKALAGMMLAEAFEIDAVEHTCEVDLEDPQHPLRRDPLCLKRGIQRFTQIRLSGVV